MINKKIYYLFPFIIIIGIISFGLFRTISLSLDDHGIISLANYEKIFNDEDFKKALLYSFRTAFISTTLTLLVGIFFALRLYHSKSKIIVKIITFLPIILPHLVVAMLMIILLSQTGIISRICAYLGLIDNPSQFLELINDRNGIGVIIAYVYKEFPFVALVLYGIIITINKKELLIAQSLKANNFIIFKDIILPKILPMLLALFTILFIYSFSAYEIPSLLGYSSTKALPVYIYYNYSNIMLGTKNYAMALNVIIIIFSLCFAGVMYLIINKLQGKKKQ